MKIRFPRVAQIITVLVASVTMLAAPSAVASQAAVSAPRAASTCSTDWGSTQKSAGTLERGTLQGLRAGRHACFDRLVIDMSGVAPGYTVKYVNKVRREGRGDVVPVAGGARLLVVARKGTYSVPGMPSVSGFDTFRQVAFAGSFEGQTSLGLGVRARLPFRAFVLDDPETHSSRLVIDVAHTW